MGIVAAIDRFNQARPWSHNSHYYPWILRQLPARFGAALDVGCGSGDLAGLLAARADSVVGVDVDADIISHATARPNVHHVTGDALALPDARYDVITAVASLHHMPLDEALSTFRRWLSPGGTLVVIGLTTRTPADYLLMPIATPANMLVSLRHGKGPRPVAMAAPVRAPNMTLRQLRAHVRRHLPGARIRRRLFFRYSLVYRA